MSPVAAPIACARCGKASPRRVCDDCRKRTEQRIDADRSNDAIRQKYKTANWKKLSLLIRRLNPVCQRIVDNPFGGREQCHSPSAMVHHKIAPTVDAAQFFRASNLIALCDACHGHMEGTPEWTAGADYVETVLPQYGF